MSGDLLLVHTNRETKPEVVLPIGLVRVAEACKAAGIPTRLLDLAFVRNPEATLLAAIAEGAPRMIGLAVRNVDNADAREPIFYLPHVQRLVAAIRDHSPAPIVAGGTGVSIAPEAVREALGVDCAVSGPGEEAIVRLWGDTVDGQGLPPVVFGQTDSFEPTPRFADWIDVRPYRRRGAPLPVQTRRGCPFHCVYCNYAAIEGVERYDLAPVDSVVEAMRRELASTGLRDVEFVDSTFNAPPKYTRELCAALASADLGAGLTASGINPRFADRATLEAMRDAGFIAIMCSPDSASPATVKAWGKDFDVADLAAMAADSGDLGLPVMWSFMFGGPQEDEQTVQETLAFIREEIHPDHPVMLTARMRIYPGTALARLAIEEGYPHPTLDPTDDRQFYSSAALDPAWLDEQLVALQRSHPNLMFMEGSQSRAIPWISRVRAIFGVGGPSWTGYARTRRRLKRFGVG